MEPIRQPGGRRALLPAEVELCEAVGLSEEEYWYFVDQAELYNGERNEAYAHIPDIKNDAAVLIPALVSIAIGLVTTAVSILIAPKPKSPQIEDRGETPRNLTLGGQTGADRFAQTEGFQSVQDLAVIGQTIPLVFAKKGVRVNGSLVWSQMIAEKGYQQLRAVFVFSDGYTEGVPDYAGLAIGDTLLEGYTSKKVAAYWRQNGGRLIEPTNRIAGSGLKNLPYSDAFGTYFDATTSIEPWFSGATFTNVQSKFGAYAPMFNNTSYRPTPELVLIPADAEDEFKEALKIKRLLYDFNRFPQGSFFRSILDGSGVETVGFKGLLTKDFRILYRITTNVENPKDPEFAPNEVGFVNSSTISSRIAADSQIAEGELYLVGDKALGVCTEIQGVLGNYEPWAPSKYSDDIPVPNTNDKWYIFTITESGFVETIDNAGDVRASELNAVSNPKLYASDTYPLQRAAIATVSNTRPCSATELIIKSNVWKQVSGFTDVTAWPSEKLIAEYQENNGSIQLGTINKYLRRLSFFMLEVRTAGTDTWIDITGDKYFFVEGNTPVDQYHYIRVDTGAIGNVETEFRLRPVSGIGAIRKAQSGVGGGKMRKLQYGFEAPPYLSNGYVVVFNGKEVTLDETYATNPEFIRSSSSETREDEGAIENIGITPTEVGTFSVPGAYTWNLKGTRYDGLNYMVKRISFLDASDNYYEYVWDGSIRASGRLAAQPIEPPIGYDKSNPTYVRYKWALKDPGKENALIDRYPYRYAYRSIQREEYEQGAATNTDPAEAQTTPARHVSVANPEASGLKFYVRRWNNAAGQEIGYKWTIDINNQGTGYSVGDFVRVLWEEPLGSGIYREIYGVTITGTTTVTVTEYNRVPQNYSPFDAILDVPAYEGVSASNTSGPEHEVVAINEKIVQFTPNYQGMTIGGLRINSSSEWSNFNSFSAYMKKGIILENLIDGSAKASNLLPDIVFGMMTNTEWGAGKILGAQQVDKDSMKIASQFCNANDFTWDGVVSQRINFRDWVFQNAQYALLDATVIGGRFALVPAVPYTNTFNIGNFVKPALKALFTDGNMRDMKIQWFGPSERQLFRAEMLWREETPNGFAKTRQFTIRLSDAEGGSSTDPVETFDMSGFCTTELHAARYAYYALRLRQQVDHTITFQTTPQAAMGLIPGNYFKVASNSTHTSRFNNGSVDSEGYVTSVDGLANGSHSVYYWKSGTEGVREGTLIVSDNKVTDSAFFNTVFTVVMTSEQSRVYKLESLTYGEDGLIEISGSHMPLTSAGTLKILDWNSADFEGLGIIL